MSTQLEFIMQLYMMNLLQQQQQQQHQQQQQQQQQFALSPVKPKDLHQPSPQQQHQMASQNLRTLKRQNSQNTNSSSSRSCSPNSNLSPLPTITANSFSYPHQTTTTIPQTSLLQQQQQHLLLQHQQQAQAQQQQQTAAMNPMLLNNLPALTQLMLMQHQQQQQQQQITSSNLLLTPTTPNSSNSSSLYANNSSIGTSPYNPTPMANYLSNNLAVYGSSTAAAAAVAATGFSSSSSTPPPTTLPATAAAASSSSLFFPSAFPAQNSFIASPQNFLQSSTVTSTPTNANYNKIPSGSCAAAGDAYVVDDDEEDVNEIKNENLDAEESALTSVHSSSGNSTSTGNSKLLCSSGLRQLETTSDYIEDSTQMPFTPEKSQTSINPGCFPGKRLQDDDASNVTPVTLKNAILTPPSSEQLSSKTLPNTFEGSSSKSSSGLTGTTCSALTNTSSSSCSSAVDGFLTEENLKHLRKNSSYLECENPLCRQENLREHFHCYEEPCQGKILSKKDDIIRHLKWHKKRKESLLLGFARFSSSDDCAPEYGAGCAYNWKQTHYHCVYDECPKVYVSTSDVQMHANFHRKNSEIVQEGFRRFRAHENCKIEECPFYGKKTSHYHCCREGCNHTFKNKADMEKHKVYHMKDHQLTQDGFKKILKTEKCPFDDCKYSCVSNHIHCVRENCNYILHSSTQMISHKRKHDRAEGEQNYQQFKSQRDSSEEESPSNAVMAAAAAKAATKSASLSATNSSTPLSSLSAEHFLARKRGRPPKKIQLPSEANDSKRIKLEMANDSSSNSSATTNVNQSNPAASSQMAMLNPFMANFNPNTSAASVDPNAPNFQLTHLMALFQLQNPLFYQNLYPRGITAANMANILGAASAATQQPGNNTNASNLPQTGNNIKQEFPDKQEFKE